MTGLLWTLAIPVLIVAALAVSGARRRLRDRRLNRETGAFVAAELKRYPETPVSNEEAAAFRDWLLEQAGRP
jgi:hypothetical protein